MRYEETDRVISWQAPPRETAPYTVKGFFDDLTAQGDAWVQNQPGIANLTNDIQLLMGTGQDRDMASNLLQTWVQVAEVLSSLARWWRGEDQV